MAKRPTWIRSYMKLGREAFDDYTLSVLRLIEKKYSDDYLVFLKQLGSHFSPSTSIGEKARILERQVHQSIKTIRNLRGWYGGKATRKEISELYVTLEAIELGIKDIAEMSGTSQELKGVLVSIQEQVNVSVEEIQKAGKAIKKGVSSAKVKGKGRGGQRRDSSFRKDILRGFLGEMAVGRGDGSKTKGKTEGRRKTRLMRALTPVSIPEIGGEGPRTGATTVGGVSAGGLYEFFDQGAYKATWTRDVISELRDIRTKLTIDGKGKGVGGLLGKLALALGGGAGVVALMGGLAVTLGLLAGAVVTSIGAYNKFKNMIVGTKEVGRRAGKAVSERASADRIRQSLGLPPVAEAFGESPEVQRDLRRAKAQEKLWSSKTKIKERSKSLVQWLFPGIRTDPYQPHKGTEIGMTASIESILKSREATAAEAKRITEMLGMSGAGGRPRGGLPSPKSDVFTQKFMAEHGKTMQKVDSSLNQLVKQRGKKDPTPITKDRQFEVDTTHNWMNTN